MSADITAPELGAMKSSTLVLYVVCEYIYIYKL